MQWDDRGVVIGLCGRKDVPRCGDAPMIPAVLISEATTYPALGLAAATIASAFWAVSVVLYRRVGRVMPPVKLNMSKGLIATVILTGVVSGTWLMTGNKPWSMSMGMIALMAISGVIGIGLGDTLFFAGLNRMGARRVLLLFTINPVIMVVIAWGFMGEPLVWQQVLGIALTVGGVAWVIAERNTKKSDGHVDLLGIIFGVGAASCQAAGVLISRYVFEQGEMTEAASAWLRLGAGSLLLVLFLPVDKLLKDPGGQAHHHPKDPSKKQTRIMFMVALMLGTVGGIWLMQTAVKHADRVGVAGTLLSISPLFVLPIAAVLGEHISKRAVLGALVTVAGISMLLLNQQTP